MGAISAVKNETKRKKQMVVRRGHHEKQEVDDAFEKLCIGDSFAEAALTSSVPRRTLFKKAQGRHIGIMIEGLRTHGNIGKFCKTFLFLYSSS